MRIRKNAKISTLLNTNINISNGGDECLLQKNLCQLNQSPWDIITFPSPDSSSSLHQFDDNEYYYNVSLARNGSSIDPSGDFESVSSVKDFEGENYDFVNPEIDYEGKLRFADMVMNDIRDKIVLCDKRDEKVWQYGRVVKNGESVCDHHSVELQSHALWTTKKKPNIVHGSRPGTRSRQAKKGASTSPYEFYYYAGFGPTWGKKRGTISSVSNTYIEGEGCNKIKETKEEEKPEISMAGPTKMELSYIDEDNKRGKTGNIGKKRGRKPIKARSLKSLM